jgi:hypothetical protein
MGESAPSQLVLSLGESAPADVFARLTGAIADWRHSQGEQARTMGFGRGYAIAGYVPVDGPDVPAREPDELVE